MQPTVTRSETETKTTGTEARVKAEARVETKPKPGTKRLYWIEYEDIDGTRKDDVGVLDGAHDLTEEALRYLRGLFDAEDIEHITLREVYPVHAADADDREYNINLTPVPGRCAAA